MSCGIRLATPADAAPIEAIYRPIVERTAISFETTAPDVNDFAQRLADTLPAYPWLVSETGGVVTGYAYASRHRPRAAYRWSVDVSVYVDATHRRRGIARALYLSLIRILTAQGYRHAFAGIALPNEASVALHESIGFRPVGVYHRVGYKLGAWHDVGWWELELNAHVQEPHEPLDVEQLQRSVPLVDLLASLDLHL